MVKIQLGQKGVELSMEDTPSPNQFYSPEKTSVHFLLPFPELSGHKGTYRHIVTFFFLHGSYFFSPRAEMMKIQGGSSIQSLEAGPQ